LNGQYIRKIIPERLVDLCEPLLIEAYDTHDYEYMKKVVLAFHDRLIKINDIVPLSSYFFQDEFTYDEKGVAKYFKAEGAMAILTALRDQLATLSPFNRATIEVIFKQLAESRQVKLGAIIHPCRLALSGRLETPPMYDVVEILGKNKVIQRLEAAIASL